MVVVLMLVQAVPCAALHAEPCDGHSLFEQSVQQASLALYCGELQLQLWTPVHPLEPLHTRPAAHSLAGSLPDVIGKQ